MTLTPAYEDTQVRLFQGDARVVLPTLVGTLDVTRTVVITDPVWPNMPKGMFPGCEDTLGLFTDAASHFPALARRVCVVLGCMSDPRFLSSVPAVLPFVRACWLRYALPSNSGTVLNGSDVAYIFGSRRAENGKTLLSGEKTSARSTRHVRPWHPCPRNMDHALWLVGTFTAEGDTILDPFAGSGVFLEAAKRLGRKAVGVEINPSYVSRIPSMLRQDTLDLALGGC